MSAMQDGVVVLYVLRHAHAGDATRWSGDDAARPLSAKGHLQADRLATHLVAIRLGLDAVISSPRLRARETADPIAAALGMSVQVDGRLGGGLTLHALDDLLADAGHPGRVLIVGHDPDFSEIAAELVGAVALPMRKGALARIDAAWPLRPGGAILRWLIPPDALTGEEVV